MLYSKVIIDGNNTQDDKYTSDLLNKVLPTYLPTYIAVILSLPQWQF